VRRNAEQASSNPPWGGRSTNTYGETDLAALAAAYASGIARNHPLADGNKRTAFACMIVLLGLNGIDLDVPPAATTAVILGLAAGKVDDDGLTRWIRDSLPKS
jgi:death-on-curing protein